MLSFPICKRRWWAYLPYMVLVKLPWLKQPSEDVIAIIDHHRCRRHHHHHQAVRIMRNKTSIRPQLLCPLIWLMLTLPSLLLSECREKGFNGERSVERNESLDPSREGIFFFIILMSHQKGTYGCKMVCKHWLANSLGKLSSSPFSLEACCVLELRIKVEWSRE